MKSIVKSFSRVRIAISALTITILLFILSLYEVVINGQTNIMYLAALTGGVSLAFGCISLVLMIHSSIMENRKVTKEQNDQMIESFQSIKPPFTAFQSELNKHEASINNLKDQTVKSIGMANRSIVELLSDIESMIDHSNIELSENNKELIQDLRSETQRSIGVVNRSIMQLKESSAASNAETIKSVVKTLGSAEVRQLILLQELGLANRLPENFSVPMELNAAEPESQTR